MTLLRGSWPPKPKPYEPNAVLRWWYRRFFSHIQVDGRWSTVVRQAQGQGVVVYVMRSLSFLDFLCLDFLVKRFSLPLVRFVNDLGLWILEPFGKGGRRIRLRRQIPEDLALTRTVQEGFSALLFMRRPPRIGRFRKRGERLQVDLVRTLIETQRTSQTPILLVPQTFVWNKLSSQRRRGFFDLVFGSNEWPGKIRVLFQFLLNFRNAKLRSGEPFDLLRFLRENPHLSDVQAADKVRYAMLRRTERERTMVLGPTMKPPSRLREELLRSPRLRKHIAAEARSRKVPVARVERWVRKELRKLAASPNAAVLSMLDRLLAWVWHRIYDGIVVDREGLERVRNAAREGTLVLLPSHKSHADYLVLSWVLHAYSLSPPLIAAGDNLGFWPLGPILRRAGAFFVRRSFRGKKLYAAVVDAYVRKLLKEGFPLEFFIEGGRSRTGKLLQPKYGLLSMVVDAALTLRSQKIFFVPISIGYERIIEERSYVHELGGGEKGRENISGLLRTPRVLRSRYGRLYVQFGAVLPFDALLPEGEHPVPSHGQRRSLVQYIGRRVVHEIDRVTVITPTGLVATALLNHRRRGMTHDNLLGTIQMLLVVLEQSSANIAFSVRSKSGALREETIAEALQLFIDGRLVTVLEAEGEPIYTVPDERRMALEYYKNNLLHFFVPTSLVATVVLGRRSAVRAGSSESPTNVAAGLEPGLLQSAASRSEIVKGATRLADLLRHEFVFDPDADFAQVADTALDAMLMRGELRDVRGELLPAAGEDGAIEAYAAILRPYLESYRLTVRAMRTIESGSLSRNQWIRRALSIGQRMYLGGELELREALSRSKLENAMLVFRDLGLLRIGKGDVIQRGSRATDAGELEALESDLGVLAG